MAATEAYPRDLAIRILTRVLSDGQSLPDALEALAASENSRGWLQEVCSGTLRWKGRLDLILDSMALHKKPSGWLRKALLIAAYQLVAQDRTSPGAVVSETVTLIKRKEGEPPSRFANATLRKIADHAPEWRKMPLAPGASPKEAAAWASLPQWLWDRLDKEKGREWAQAYANASLERPSLWLRSREAGWNPPSPAEAGPIPGAWRLPQGGAIEDIAGFAEGAFIVQDISGQKLVSELKQALPGSTVRALDLCASPGGKAIGMAWNGWEVSATDRDETRIALLRKSVERAKGPIGVQVLARDAVAALPPQDIVWIDAPCTGSGIIRRHPDVRWLRQEKDVASLTALQKSLLAEGARKVAPGGALFYSVCSVLHDEGPGVIESFLGEHPQAWQRHSEWFLVPQEAPFGDGFWAALLKRI